LGFLAPITKIELEENIGVTCFIADRYVEKASRKDDKIGSLEIMGKEKRGYLRPISHPKCHKKVIGSPILREDGPWRNRLLRGVTS
jgi:hypothetical protein